MREGREVQTLRKLEQTHGMRNPIEMRLSRSSLEPGIFGITRPVMLWPEGISAPLSDAHLEAVLAHELCHVRRRDNLAATLHMVVEAVFWFHPVVWWMGSRLVVEREKACDEAVLESGSDRHVYAESILKICEFCISSPLSLVSGVTGANLNKRIAYIMSERIAHKLDLARKLLLSTAAFLAITTPIAFGLLHATQTRAASLQITSTPLPSVAGEILVMDHAAQPVAPQGQPSAATERRDTAASVSSPSLAIPPVFVAISIKSVSGNLTPGLWFTSDQLNATNVTLKMLLEAAYGVENRQIGGAPSWLNSDKYDIKARIDKSVVHAMQSLGREQRLLQQKRLLQEFLADRFELRVHRQTQGTPEYDLIVGENGPRLREAKPGDNYADGLKQLDGTLAGPGVTRFSPGEIIAQAIQMSVFAEHLSQLLGVPVLDKTATHWRL